VTTEQRPPRVARLLANQKVRFLLVGGFNTVFGYAMFAGFYRLLFADLPLGYLLSLALSYAIAVTVAFFLYRRFVFPVVGRLCRDFLAFLGVNAVAILVNFALLPVLVEILGVYPLVAQAVVVVCTTLISYFGHRSISFRRPAAAGTVR
jgi:putative flippase GtrA